MSKPKLYLFAIGGTGSRVLKSLTMLLASGIKVNTEKIIPMISEGWLKPNGYIYIEKESESDLSCLPNHWQLEKEKRAGQLTYSLYKVIT